MRYWIELKGSGFFNVSGGASLSGAFTIWFWHGLSQIKYGKGSGRLCHGEGELAKGSGRAVSHQLFYFILLFWANFAMDETSVLMFLMGKGKGR